MVRIRAARAHQGAQLTTDEQLTAAFLAGVRCSERGGYLSDCTYPYEGELWQAWRDGFAHEEGPCYVLAKHKENN